VVRRAHSAPGEGSFDKEQGATRVVVVIVSPYRGKGTLSDSRLAGIRGRSLLWSSCNNEFKEPEKFAYLRGVMMKGGRSAT